MIKNDLREMIAERDAKIVSLTNEITELRQELEWFKKELFGSKSEKTQTVLENAEQINIFNEAEGLSEPGAAREITVPEHKRRSKRTRDEIMASVRREQVICKPEQTCENCGSRMEVIGHEKIREELIYVPADIYVREYISEVVKCPKCGSDESKDGELQDIAKRVIRRGAAPEPMIAHSFCSPELLAHVAYEKYCNAVPLNRIEKDFKEKKVTLSRTTMSNWIVYSAEKWLRPIVSAMRSELLRSDVINADETVIQVLNEPGRKPTTDSRMWVYANGKVNDKNIIIFEYTPTRSGMNAVKFLGDYSGYLVCDGYDGYNRLTKVTRCGCWAHMRRKLLDALPVDESERHGSVQEKGIAFCNALFSLEREYNGETALRDESGNITGWEKTRDPLTPEERVKQRQERSRPILDDFFAWLDTISAAPKTKLSSAIQYAKNEKVYLRRFIENGDIPISNNRAENAIRPFVIGRKNWLFSASAEGADASSLFYSVITSAKENGLKAEDYLTKIFSSRPGTILLPW